MHGILAAARRGGNDPGAWIVIAFAVGIVVAIVIVAVIAKRNRRKRAEAMERIAGELGLEYRPIGGEGIVDRLGHFQLFSKGRSKKVLNMLKGGSGDRTLSICDYLYTTGGGKSTHVWKTTVLSLQFDGAAMPAFMLRRKQAGDTIASWFRGRGIEFVGRPVFSKRYYLRGDDEPAIRAVFTEPVVDYFEENLGLFVEGAGNTMVVYRLGKQVKPEAIGEFLAKGLELLGVMRAG